MVRAVFCLLLTAVLARAEWPFPAAEGTTWNYTLTREPEQQVEVISWRVADASEPESLRLEETANGALSGTRFLRDEGGAVIETPMQEVGGDKPLPSTILPAELHAGASWDFHATIAGTELALPLRVLGEEQVETSAGTFRAWHIRGEQDSSVGTTVDEWFVPDVGWVKESVTHRAPDGTLLARRTLALTVMPAAARAIKAAPQADAFEASLSTSVAGAAVDVISDDALQIVLRWRARHHAPGGKVRAVWIAQQDGDDVQVDEASAALTPPESVGAFTLSRPPDGWTPGKYRVDFYLRSVLAASFPLTIARRAEPLPTPPEF